MHIIVTVNTVTGTKVIHAETLWEVRGFFPFLMGVVVGMKH